MKLLYWSIPLLMVAIGMIYSLYPDRPIVSITDYEQYLDPVHLAAANRQLEAEITFWEEKLEQSSGNQVYRQKLAACLAGSFKKTGQIARLHQSDSLLHLVRQRLPSQVGVLHQLAANAVTQHQFEEANQYTNEALATGEQQFAGTLLFIDLLLERGFFVDAARKLEQIQTQNHFDFLIRKMKYEDAMDRLGQAIRFMEKAARRAEQSQKESLINWAYSNLGDMYGHDGRIEEAYQAYLKALKVDPADLHSLKGIAWISFSHDHNSKEASRILHFLKSIHPVPDYDLLLAEIAWFEGEEHLADRYETAFVDKASLPEYGKMYYSYLIEQSPDTPEAQEMIELELKDRPHPVIMDLYAWTLHQRGETSKAVDFMENYVLGHTGEPIVAYHAGLLFKANGNTNMARKYLRAAQSASFELGPVISLEIEQELREM